MSHRIEPEDLLDPNRYPHNPLDLLLYQSDGRYAPVSAFDCPRESPVWLNFSINVTKEQQYMDDNRYRNIDQYRKIDEKTDSWHIGSAAWQTMICEGVPGAPKYDLRAAFPKEQDELMVALQGFSDATLSTNAENFLTGTRYHGGNFYTRALRDLVIRCCKWQQSERPTLREINDIATYELSLFVEEPFEDPEASLLKFPLHLDTFDVGTYLDGGELPFLPTPIPPPRAPHGSTESEQGET